MEGLRPARYFPIRRGVFEMVPGLYPLGTEFGNGPQDGKFFQFDDQYPKYRANKDACRAEDLSIYFQRRMFTPELERAACALMRQRLSLEWPQYFSERTEGSVSYLNCALSKEILAFSPKGDYLPERSTSSQTVPYVCAYDALASQVCEDVSLMSRDQASGRASLVAIHLCSPEGWSAESKIEKSFQDIHLPVPDIQKINNKADALMELMVNKGPFTRFAWGLNSDDKLNHHPRKRSKEHRLGDPQSLFLRVERQVTWGLPEVDASLFTIRVYFYPLSEVLSGLEGIVRRELLANALLSMQGHHLAYKSMTPEIRDGIVEYCRNSSLP